MKILVVFLVILVAGCSSSSTEVNGTLPATQSDHFTYIFAGTQFEGLFRSSDLGVTWTETNYPKVYPVGLIDYRGVLFSPSAGQGVFTSTDNGLTWNRFSIDHSDITAIAEFDSLLVIGTEVGNVVSSDGGGTWSTGDVNLTAALYPRAFAEAQQTLFSAGSRGVASSVNGKAWNQDGGLSDCYGIASNETDLFLGTYEGLFWSSNTGKSWARIDSNLKTSPYCLGVIGTSLFVGSDSGLFRTTDHGMSWSQIDFALNNKTAGAGAVLCRGKHVLVAGSNQQIFLSADTGTTWTQTTPLSDNIIFVGVK